MVTPTHVSNIIADPSDLRTLKPGLQRVLDELVASAADPVTNPSAGPDVPSEFDRDFNKFDRDFNKFDRDFDKFDRDFNKFDRDG